MPRTPRPAPRIHAPGAARSTPAASVAPPRRQRVVAATEPTNAAAGTPTPAATARPPTPSTPTGHAPGNRASAAGASTAKSKNASGVDSLKPTQNTAAIETSRPSVQAPWTLRRVRSEQRRRSQLSPQRRTTPTSAATASVPAAASGSAHAAPRAASAAHVIGNSVNQGSSCTRQYSSARATTSDRVATGKVINHHCTHSPRPPSAVFRAPNALKRHASVSNRRTTATLAAKTCLAGSLRHRSPDAPRSANDSASAKPALPRCAAICSIRARGGRCCSSTPYSSSTEASRWRLELPSATR